MSFAMNVAEYRTPPAESNVNGVEYGNLVQSFMLEAGRLFNEDKESATNFCHFVLYQYFTLQGIFEKSKTKRYVDLLQDRNFLYEMTKLVGVIDVLVVSKYDVLPVNIRSIILSFFDQNITPDTVFFNKDFNDAFATVFKEIFNEQIYLRSATNEGQFLQAITKCIQNLKLSEFRDLYSSSIESLFSAKWKYFGIDESLEVKYWIFLKALLNNLEEKDGRKRLADGLIAMTTLLLDGTYDADVMMNRNHYKVYEFDIDRDQVKVILEIIITTKLPNASAEQVKAILLPVLWTYDCFKLKPENGYTVIERYYAKLFPLEFAEKVYEVVSKVEGFTPIDLFRKISSLYARFLTISNEAYDFINGDWVSLMGLNFEIFLRQCLRDSEISDFVTDENSSFARAIKFVSEIISFFNPNNLSEFNALNGAKNLSKLIILRLKWGTFGNLDEDLKFLALVKGLGHFLNPENKSTIDYICEIWGWSMVILDEYRNSKLLGADRDSMRTLLDDIARMKSLFEIAQNARKMFRSLNEGNIGYLPAYVYLEVRKIFDFWKIEVFDFQTYSLGHYRPALAFRELDRNEESTLTLLAADEAYHNLVLLYNILTFKSNFLINSIENEDLTSLYDPSFVNVFNNLILVLSRMRNKLFGDQKSFESIFDLQGIQNFEEWLDYLANIPVEVQLDLNDERRIFLFESWFVAHIFDVFEALEHKELKVLSLLQVSNALIKYMPIVTIIDLITLKLKDKENFGSLMDEFDDSYMHYSTFSEDYKQVIRTMLKKYTNQFEPDLLESVVEAIAYVMDETVKTCYASNTFSEFIVVDITSDNKKRLFEVRFDLVLNLICMFDSSSFNYIDLESRKQIIGAYLLAFGYEVGENTEPPDIPRRKKTQKDVLEIEIEKAVDNKGEVASNKREEEMPKEVLIEAKNRLYAKVIQICEELEVTSHSLVNDRHKIEKAIKLIRAIKVLPKHWQVTAFTGLRLNRTAYAVLEAAIIVLEQSRNEKRQS